MNHLPLIIKREYLSRVKNKAFIIMTFVSPMVLVVLITGITYLTQVNKDNIRVISVLDESKLLSDIFVNTKKTTYHILKNMSLYEAKALSKETNSYGLLHISNINNLETISGKVKFYSKESPSLSVIADLESQIQNELTHQNRIREGIDVDKLKRSRVKVDIIQESFQFKKISRTDGIVKLIFGIAAGYLLFMFIIIYGNMIMRSIIEEKTSRIIEILLSSVKPKQLMLGKIIGTSLVGVTQFIIWLILGSAIISTLAMVFSVDILQMQTSQEQLVQWTAETPDLNMKFQDIMFSFYNLPIANLITAFILFFIGGYLFYSSLYAAIGAAVDNETDTQQFILPIMMPLILAVYVGIFTVVEDPHGMISIIFSLIPLTSPVVMLMRIPFGVTIWQQLISFVLLIGSFIFNVWFAAKIYRNGILTYGKKASYKELIKWIKY